MYGSDLHVTCICIDVGHYQTIYEIKLFNISMVSYTTFFQYLRRMNYKVQLMTKSAGFLVFHSWQFSIYLDFVSTINDKQIILKSQLFSYSATCLTITTYIYGKVFYYLLVCFWPRLMASISKKGPIKLWHLATGFKYLQVETWNSHENE